MIKARIQLLVISIISIFLFGSQGGMANTSTNIDTKGSASISLPAKAKVIDLTQTVSKKTPSWDGSKDDFKYEVLSTVDKDGYGSGAFFMHEHFGTHIDAPVHFCKGGLSVDEINAVNLVLPLVVIDVQDEVKANPDYLLTLDKVKQIEKKISITKGSAIVLLTGWSEHYFVDGKYRNADDKGVMHFPGFSAEAVKHLIEQYQIAALGIDTLSIDHGPSQNFPVHTLALEKGLFMAENLTNLNQLPEKGAVIIFAPLKIQGGTGAPARVLALIPQK